MRNILGVSYKLVVEYVDEGLSDHTICSRVSDGTPAL
jgi:hypothetical protein